MKGCYKTEEKDQSLEGELLLYFWTFISVILQETRAARNIVDGGEKRGQQTRGVHVFSWAKSGVNLQKTRPKLFIAITLSHLTSLQIISRLHIVQTH